MLIEIAQGINRPHGDGTWVALIAPPILIDVPLGTSHDKHLVPKGTKGVGAGILSTDVMSLTGHWWVVSVG